MKRKSKQKGITLIALIITIVVLLILASIATYSGIEIIESSKLQRFTAEMKIMQTQVNSLYDKWKRGELDKNIIGRELNCEPDVQEQANKVLTTELDIKDTTGYRYYDQETIKEQGIEGVEQEFFINVEKREVVSYKGLKYNGEMYYTLVQLPDGLYNIDYNPEIYDKPTFEVRSEKIEENKWKITISNIQYEGEINKWEVKYKLAEKNYENVTEDMSFIVTEKGTYDISIRNGEIESDPKQVVIGEVNEPVLGKGMVPVKWGNEEWITTSQTDSDWYEYKEQEGK